jgi:hypothetical protein
MPWFECGASQTWCHSSCPPWALKPLLYVHDQFLRLRDALADPRHFHPRLRQPTLLQQAHAHAEPVCFFGDAFVRDPEFLAIDLQIPGIVR